MSARRWWTACESVRLQKYDLTDRRAADRLIHEKLSDNARPKAVVLQALSDDRRTSRRFSRCVEERASDSGRANRNRPSIDGNIHSFGESPKIPEAEAELSDRLHLEGPGVERKVREVTGEDRIVGREISSADDEFTIFAHRGDSIDEEEGLAVWE